MSTKNSRGPGRPPSPKSRTEREKEKKQRYRKKKLRKQQLLETASKDKASRRRSPLRVGNDFWRTEPALAAALIQYVLPTLPQGVVWECGAGDGMLVDALEAAGREVIATDIEPQRRGIARLDFLNDPPSATTRGAVLITNPPFGRSGLLDPFLRRAMSLLDDGHLSAVVFLQRANSVATVNRLGVFNRAADEWTCCWRARWIPDTKGSPRWWFHWIVWRQGETGPPVNRRITQKGLDLRLALPRAPHKHRVMMLEDPGIDTDEAAGSNDRAAAPGRHEAGAPDTAT